MAKIARMEKYECIFCGVPVEQNVMALLAITEWEQDEVKQRSQQFFCHLECFKKTMKNSDYLYIDEDEK